MGSSNSQKVSSKFVLFLVDFLYRKHIKPGFRYSWVHYTFKHVILSSFSEICCQNTPFFFMSVVMTDDLSTVSPCIRPQFFFAVLSLLASLSLPKCHGDLLCHNLTTASIQRKDLACQQGSK